MGVRSQLASLQSENRQLTRPERVLNCCALAKRLEKAGEYQSAAEALNEFWPNPRKPPTLDELPTPIQAELLLRVGALAGWLGRADQTGGSQETAKNLITRSIEIFAGIGKWDRVAEARSDLALCYWREGAFDESRINLAESLRELKTEDGDLRACILIRSGMVEATAGRWSDALRFYQQATPYAEASCDAALKGSYHNSVAAVLTTLAEAESREDYLDQALIEYTAASIHFEAAENIRYCALVENNLGYLFSTIGKFNEAYRHIDRARALFTELGDRGHIAQVDDAQARVLLAAGESVQAERFARVAVRVLEKGDQHSLLSEALTTHGTALARMGKDGRASAAFNRAIEFAQTAGDSEGAGRATLAIIEELSERMSAEELVPIYRSAVNLLRRSQDPSIKTRLIASVEELLNTLYRLHGQDPQVPPDSWEGFSLKRHVRDTERAVIERALRDAGGSVTKASHLLGYKHHQSLISLINTRHKELLNTRSTVHRRRHHVFSVASKAKKKRRSHRAEDRDIRILHVEDNEAVATFVRDALSDERMRLDHCADGIAALEILKGSTPYDLMIVDNDLPGLSGLELVLRSKSLPHRRNMQIVMLSGDEIEKEAWRAGVHEFLRKPKDVDRLNSAVLRLLKASKPGSSREHQ